MEINGVINCLKPPGMTSFDVIAYLRSLTGGKNNKFGHAGTLDPLAAGVLPVCAGNATKAIEYLMGGIKEYRAEITFGVTTDTYDSDGKVTGGSIIGTGSVDVREEDFVKALSAFKGTIMQVPPAFSAVRINGKRMYELARKGIEMDRPAREVTVYEIRLADFAGSKAIFDVICSKGTYIRSICHDIGQSLGCGAHMSFLARLASGRFRIGDSVTLEEIASAVSAGNLDDIVKPVELFLEFEEIRLDDGSMRAFRNGMQSDCGFYPTCGQEDGTLYKVFDVSGAFAGIGKVSKNKGRYMLKPEKLIGAYR